MLAEDASRLPNPTIAQNASMWHDTRPAPDIGLAGAVLGEFERILVPLDRSPLVECVYDQTTCAICVRKSDLRAVTRSST
jgi:hypothetical protein